MAARWKGSWGVGKQHIWNHSLQYILKDKQVCTIYDVTNHEGIKRNNKLTYLFWRLTLSYNTTF